MGFWALLIALIFQKTIQKMLVSRENWVQITLSMKPKVNEILYMGPHPKH